MLPRLLITMGDLAGIGPEVIARAWPSLIRLCQPIVIGDPSWMRWAIDLVGAPLTVSVLTSVDDSSAENDRCIPLFCPLATTLDEIKIGTLSAAGGRAAYEFLCSAIDLTLAGKAAGIVTLPLQKEGLHAAGLHYPGHTEILAERTGTREFGMMLYVRGEQIPHGLGVVHVTLHQALRDVFAHITTPAVLEKIRLLRDVLTKLCDRPPCLAVAALNPHASDGGIFGDEEARILEPAVQHARHEGINVHGPIPSDTLFLRAQRGEFDGVVAMYHDQGHIPLKLLSGLGAVNVTLGLPIVRTSVAHGTAYDIAGKGIADPRSLLEAARVAARLADV